MKDIIINVSRETRMVDLTKSFIGNDSENLQGDLVFEFSDSFVSGVARIEYDINNEKQYQMLIKENESYRIPIKSVLTKEGQHDMQLVITEDDDLERFPVFKSNVFYVRCGKSINAEIEQPDEYPTWIEVANKTMIKMEKIVAEAEQMEREALQLDEDVRKLDNDFQQLDNDVKQLEQDINNTEVEVENLTNNINLIANDINTHTEEINSLEQGYNRLNNELIDQEESINHLDDIKADKETTYTKDQVNDKLKSFVTTSSLIAGINTCEPKMADTVDYIIETGLYGNGESGYRKYKNGIIEQWGVASTQANETEFTMHKPHINQNFSIFIEPREQGNFYHYAIPSANQKFKCRIQSRDSVSMVIRFQWRSYGRWK